MDSGLVEFSCTIRLWLNEEGFVLYFICIVVLNSLCRSLYSICVCTFVGLYDFMFTHLSVAYVFCADMPSSIILYLYLANKVIRILMNKFT